MFVFVVIEQKMQKRSISRPLVA